MASGLAKGAKDRGKRVAFGNGQSIIWDQHSETVFKNNPNVARPGTEDKPDIEWVPFYKGHRQYNRQSGDRWIWNYDFKATPGELYLDAHELAYGRRLGKGFVVVEPSVPSWKSCAPNKDWGFDKYTQLVSYLRLRDVRVIQFKFHAGAQIIDGVEKVKTLSFREACALLKNASLFIGPEGGMHHAAAALRIPAVVIFGGFIPPAVTGYDTHTNMIGSDEFCGSLKPCEHCRKAMENIRVDAVYEAAMRRL